ncbi:hypothetical protein GCM10023172_29220 [Hymenobacter ginsengisoli]|uniref:IPT/TIG domain-containing protein n=1 Tax=Hymenobacter ginsengisoli TaxID=1051626 RepID=A0ABP8QI05_9BACT|nr:MULTISPECIES: FG-GAP-like repeat-containing protein [unclassified Hymenobacter]MBO2029822.1 VCBS repeat-containing protein [Hymenobacter sp. BT559]
MQLVTFRPSRWVGLALLWLLGSLAGHPAAATSLTFKPVPAGTARITQGNINRLEYFVDADPGLGNGTAVPFTPGTDVSGITFSVNLAALTAGFHRLSTRVQDVGGVWSLTNTRSFYLPLAPTSSPTLANITKAEYFIDAEPGLGNGVNIPIATPATDVSGLAFVVDLTPLTVGFHRLSTRSRDVNGTWSLTTTRSFYYQPASAITPAPANITRVEYYFDTDPGFGSATSVPVPTPAPDVANLGFAVDLNTLADGAHRLFIRSRDANGKWSLVSNAAFTKSGCASSANFAASLPAASYVGTSTSGTLSSQPSVAFNTDPASPSTGNSPYFSTAGTLQADLGTTQTISEVRVRLTAVSAANSTTIQLQTAASAAGPFTTIDTYVAPLVANTTLLVARKLATPVSARVLRLQFQNSNSSYYVVVSGAGAFNFQCLTPSITSLTPNSGPVGTSLTVTGANLQGTTQLTFAGTSNNTVTTGFAVSADGTQITGVVVPSGATTGNVTATTANGTSNGVNFTVTAQPSLASLAPASGVAGSTIVLNGANLTGATTITFAGTSSNTVTTGFAVNSAGTQITGVVVPSGATTGNVTVTTPGGTSNGVVFTLTPAPTISALNPTSGPVGTSVTVTGTNLSGASAVAFNGTAATGYTVNSAGTQLTVAVPTGASTGNVTVTTPGGTSNSLTFSVTAAPVVSAFSPTYVQPGDALTITGQNLQGLTQLKIGGAVQSSFTVNVAGTQITTTVPGASYMVNGTTYPLTSRLIAVTTPGGSAASATKLRIFNVTGYYDGAQGYNTPPSQVVGGLYRLHTGDQVYVRGSGFLGATGAAFVAGASTGCGSTMTLAATPTIVNDSMLYVPFQYNLAGLGYFTTGVNITTTLGSQTPQGYNGNAFFFNPQIDSPFASCLSPTSGPASTRVTVTGSWLFGGNNPTGLTFNGVAGQNFTASTSGTQQTVSADLPASLSPGAVAVRVTGTGPGFASTTDPSVVLPFTLTGPTSPPAPALSSLSALSGPVGTSLTITGTNLTNTSSITFAGTSNNTVTTGFTVNATGTQITGVVVPSGAQTGSVTVTTPGGSSNGLPFTVIAAPVLTSLNPTSGPVGSSVTLTGTNLTGATAVSFNGTAATNVVMVSATTVTATVPTGATTGNVTVTTPGGTSNGVTFTVAAPLTIASTSPAANTASASSSAPVVVTFNQALDASAASALKVFSSQRGGLRTAATSATVSGSTLIFSPSAYNFQPGETVFSTVTTAATAGGAALTTPLVFQFTAATAAGTGTFGSKTSYSSGPYPDGVALGDVNGDGHLDMVTANYGSVTGSGNTASVFLGTGTGSFGAKTDFATGSAPDGIVLGDVNGDGLLDMLTCNISVNTVSVLLGTGTGSFGAKTDFVTGIGPYHLALGDVNGDGRLDIVTVNSYASTASVLLGTGTGSFGAKTDFATGGIPLSVALGDVNGDGRLDMVTANASSNTASVLLGTGTGSFGPKTDYAAGSSPFGVALGDLNADGLLDVVVTNEYGNSASVMLRLSSGGFGPKTDYPTAAGPRGVALGDVNGDGRLDMVTTNNAASSVSVLLGTGTGTFGNKTNFNTANTQAFDVALGDVDGDGRLDIAATGQGTNSVAVLLGQGSAPLDLVISTGTQASPTAVAAGTYHSITVTSTGVAQLVGSTSVTGSIVINGAFDTNCQPLTGTADFTLAAGGTLAICDPLGLSTTAGQGAVQTTGTRTFSTDASYVYTGKAAQVTGDALPRQVRNLGTISGTTVTLTAPVAVAQVVAVAGAGNLVLNGQSLTLLSSAAGTALVVNSGTGTVVGTGTMQRYIDASGNTGASGYRHYSAPVSNSTVADLATTATGGAFTPVVNPAYNTSATPPSVTPYPNVFGYDETRLATSPAAGISAFDKGYFSPAALSDPLAVGRGYTVQIGNQELVDFRGSFNNGPITLAGLSRGTDPDAGWQLLGNPYPAPLDWGTVGAPNTGGSGLAGLDAAAYVFQSTSAYAGRYRSFVNGVGAGTGVLAAGQGFFVRTSAAGTPGTLTLTNANRLTSYAAGQPAVQRTASTRPLLRLSLGLGATPATPATAQDETFVYFEAGATAGFDSRFDAYKLLNSNGYYLATAITPAASPAVGVSVDGRAPLAAGATADEVIPVWLQVPAGTYSLTATELVNFTSLAGGTTVYLRDGLAGTLTDLGQQPSYTFSVAAGAATSGRFELVFRPAGPLATASASLASAQATLYPNPAATTAEVTLAVTGLPALTAALEVQLLDILGRLVGNYTLAVRQGAGQLHVPTAELPSGVYVLRLATRNAQGQATGTLPTQRLVLR